MSSHATTVLLILALEFGYFGLVSNRLFRFCEDSFHFLLCLLIFQCSDGLCKKKVRLGMTQASCPTGPTNPTLIVDFR